MKTPALLALLASSYGLAVPAPESCDRTSAAAAADTDNSPCQLPEGDFVIRRRKLYPENIDFDEQSCTLWTGALYEAKLVAINVMDGLQKGENITGIYTDETGKNITIEGEEMHASGIQVSQDRRKVWSILNAGAPFDTQGNDTEGPNFIMQYDMEKGVQDWVVDLNKKSGQGIRGFQDVEWDADGNVYALSSFPGSLVKIPIDDHDKAAEYWVSEQSPRPKGEQTPKGITGLARLNGTALLVVNQADGKVWLYQMGEAANPVPVPVTGGDGDGDGARVFESSDGAYLPPKYKGRVLLIPDQKKGTAVVVSNDGWATGRKLGTVPKATYPGEQGYTTASVEMMGRLFSLTTFFFDAKTPGTAGDREEFPLTDITKPVQDMVDNQLGDGGDAR
ncbi:hypothetical protein CDD83_156 [Cordyceps sp. RAO-2017]|nr:hypothetical protein CDD83_156 [Cordyceps sp. RAO-2017]